MRRLPSSAPKGEENSIRSNGFALDEYVGIPLEHPESYASAIARAVVEPLRMDPAGVQVPDGHASDLEAAAAPCGDATATAGGAGVKLRKL